MKEKLTNDEIYLTCLCCKNQIKDDEDFHDIVGCIFCKHCVDDSFNRHFDAKILTKLKKQEEIMSEQTNMSIYLSNEKTKKYLQSILGERTNQFITSLTSLASSSNYLKNCDRNSLLACALKAESMNLPFDPNLGFAWAVPYKNTATFQIGCKGYIQLALRTGRYKALNSRDVREGKFVGRDFVGDPIIEWIPDDVRPEKPVIGYMAGIELTNGFRKIIFCSIQEVEDHALKYSQSFRKYKQTGKSSETLWASQFDKMARKTLMKSLISKFGIMSTDMQDAIKSDHSSLKIDFDTGDESIKYPDNSSDLEKLPESEGENNEN